MVGSMDDMLNTANIVVNNTDNGKCSNCGECCGNYLPLSAEDIKRIHKYLKTHEAKDHRNVVLQAEFDFTCPFRDNVKRVCSIYEARPEICRTFKCDQSPETIAKNKTLFEKRYKVVSMRQAFFGKGDVAEDMQALFAALAARAE